MRDASFGMAARGRKSKAAMHMPMRAVFFVAVGGGAWFLSKSPPQANKEEEGGAGVPPACKGRPTVPGGGV